MYVCVWFAQMIHSCTTCVHRIRMQRTMGNQSFFRADHVSKEKERERKRDALSLKVNESMTDGARLLPNLQLLSPLVHRIGRETHKIFLIPVEKQRRSAASRAKWVERGISSYISIIRLRSITASAEKNCARDFSQDSVELRWPLSLPPPLRFRLLLSHPP